MIATTMRLDRREAALTGQPLLHESKHETLPDLSDLIALYLEDVVHIPGAMPASQAALTIPRDCATPSRRRPDGE